jgi:hypothetical protein
MNRNVLWIALSVILVVSCVGCRRGDIQAELVIKGQPAPFSGYTITPAIYAEEGQPVIGSGVHVHIDGVDPNDFLE